MNTTEAKKNEILKRVYDLINDGQGYHHFEVNGEEAEAIFDEIKAMKDNGDLT